MTRLLAAMCALLALGVSVRSAADPTITADGASTLSTFLRDSVAAGRVPGVVAMVVSAERVVYQGAFGKLKVAGGVDMPTDAIFRIASMTKPMTSTAVMMLVAEGKLKLDDEVSRYIPRFASPTVLTTVKPLGMVDTAFDVPAARHGRVVTVHQRTNGRYVEIPNPDSLAVVGDVALQRTPSQPQ